MNPRRFINLLRSPSGALTLFVLGLAIVLILVNSRRGSNGRSDDTTAVTPKPANGQQITQTVERNISPFNPPQPSGTPPRATAPAPAKQAAATPTLPPISLFAETPAPENQAKTFSADFAPFGRLIPCELVITVDSSSINTPIVGLVTEDIFHHGQLIVPAGTEVHGTAQVDRARERIASDGRWTLVWQNGEELNVSGLALDHEREVDTGTWAITDGSAGLRGRLLKSDDLAEVKLYVAALLSGAADVFTEKNTSAFGSFTLPSLQNAPLKGAQSVLDRYSQQILTSIERDGFYVRVPAGKQFYLYVTQTLDQDDAKIGGTLAQQVTAPTERGAAQAAPATPQSPNFRGNALPLRMPASSTPQPRR
ncbi:MAG: TrbI/VirB10 family protein [Chthoniobacter sp.]|uniref:TrbI/VirB10 family protein n=1 Tax=Chthoniobacter sp. TaxID=2510640 RepID=UPI0032A81D3C